MTILRIDSSINGPRSAGRSLVDLVVAEIVAQHHDAPFITRDLAADPIPSNAWADAVIGGRAAEADRTDAQRDAVAIAASLVEELRVAEQVVIASPLYNFGISQHLKTWIDLVIAGAPVRTRHLQGKATVLVVTRGGTYGAGSPREGWDHATGYVKRILADVWGADLIVVEREYTLVGVNPALDDVRELAATIKSEAESAATAAGKHLAQRRAESASAEAAG